MSGVRSQDSEQEVSGIESQVRGPMGCVPGKVGCPPPPTIPLFLGPRLLLTTQCRVPTAYCLLPTAFLPGEPAGTRTQNPCLKRAVLHR